MLQPYCPQANHLNNNYYHRIQISISVSVKRRGRKGGRRRGSKKRRGRR
jgi:hypothetical protein